MRIPFNSDRKRMSTGVVSNSNGSGGSSRVAG